MKLISLTILLMLLSVLSWSQVPINEDSLRKAWKADKKLDPARIEAEIQKERVKIKNNTNLINQAAFIFEAAGLQYNRVETNLRLNQTYVYVLVRVGRVFRGGVSWQGKTLEVALVDEGPNAHESVAKSIGKDQSVLFCHKMNLPANPTPFSRDVPVSLALQASVGFANTEEDDRAGGLYGILFNSKREFYQYLGAHANIRSREITQAIATSKPIPSSKTQALSSTKPVTYQQWLTHWESEVKQQAKKMVQAQRQLKRDELYQRYHLLFR